LFGSSLAYPMRREFVMPRVPSAVRLVPRLLRPLPVWLVASGVLSAQTPYLVKDIEPGPDSSFPNDLAEWNGKVSFVANTDALGTEIWISDGTEAGTHVLKDIFPGPGNGLWQYANYFVDIGGVRYFTAQDGVHGVELWRSDGSAAGTTMVLDIDPGPENGGVPLPVDLGGFMILRADTVAHGAELWVSDGTAAGTHLLVDLNPGPGSGVGNELRPLNGGVLFAGNDGASGYEPWWSDGTIAGTMPLLDIRPGPESSIFPGMFGTGLGSWFLFPADDGVHGGEPWRTDGTAAGTQMVADLEPGPGGSFPNLKNTVLTNALLFSASPSATGTEPWRTDGTALGTYPLGDFKPGPFGSMPSMFALEGGRGAMLLDSPAHGFEPWLTDGTVANTVPAELVPGPEDGVLYTNQFWVVSGGKLYFISDTPANGYELAVSDGTLAGTGLVKDFVPGPGHGAGQLYPVADFVLTKGPALIYSDGRGDWTHLLPTLGKIQPDAGQISDACMVGTRLYLTSWKDATGAAGEELWAIDLDADGDGTIEYFDALNVAALCMCPAGVDPCGNADPSAGCANSLGAGARVDGVGSTLLSEDDLVLTISQLPPSQVGVLFQGTAQIPAVPFVDGLRCTGGSTTRWPGKFSDPAGTVTYGPGLAAFAATNLPAGFHAGPGETWTVQYWYRDPSGPCGAGSNISSGASVIFTP
jgi:ELWxxDGT repeat protein